jgi:hypothetical protein
MAELNHFAISAALGSTLGPRIPVQDGQIGSAQLAATIDALLHRRKTYIEDLNPSDNITKKFETAVIKAYQMVTTFSSDRAVADPQINAAFIEACRDLGLDNSVFHLNMALVGLRKHSKLQIKSERSIVPDQWRFAVASEIAARVMFYRYGASVDKTLAHPARAKEFDKLASSITPGFSSFQYRWAALNARKKGASVRVKPDDLERLDWSKRIPFNASSLPSDEGVYSLFEENLCLFVAGTESIDESIQNQRRIAEVKLFEPRLWQPNPQRMAWRYVTMPDENAGYRFGVVRSLVGQWKPIFNIPRGRKAA